MQVTSKASMGTISWLLQVELDLQKVTKREAGPGQWITLRCLWCKKRRFSFEDWRTKSPTELVPWGGDIWFCEHTDCFMQYQDYYS